MHLLTTVIALHRTVLVLLVRLVSFEVSPNRNKQCSVGIFSMIIVVKFLSVCHVVKSGYIAHSQGCWFFFFYKVYLGYRFRECCDYCGLAPQEAVMKVMTGRQMWRGEVRVGVQELPLRQTSLGNPATSQSVSAVREIEPWPISLRTSRYCLSFEF